MRTETDLFRSIYNTKLTFDNAWADAMCDEISINCENNDHVIPVVLSKQQAKIFAMQILEMCEEKPTQPTNTINLNGVYVNKVEK